MTKNKFFVILILLTINLFGFEANFTAEQNEVKIGDLFSVNLEINLAEKEEFKIDFLKELKIENFEFYKLKILENNKNLKKINLEYLVFADSVGTYNFGPFDLEYRAENKTEIFQTNSINLEITSNLTDKKITVLDSLNKPKQIPLDSLKTVLPIKDIIKYHLSRKEKIILFSSIAILILLGLAIYFLIKKSKRKNTKIVVKKKKIIPPHLIALDKLEALIINKYLEKKAFKDFSVELSLILREYFEESYNFNAAEMITGDLMKSLEEYFNDKELLTKAKEIFTYTDLVKFAKFTALESELKDLHQKSVEIVNQTSQIIENNKLKESN